MQNYKEKGRLTHWGDLWRTDGGSGGGDRGRKEVDDRGSRREERGCVRACRRRPAATHGEVEDGSMDASE